MNENGYSLSDLAAATGNGAFGGNNEFIWIFALLILFSGGGFGWNRNGDFGQYATAASQQEILFGQQFQGLDNKIDRLGNGICDSTYALNNSIMSEGRNMQMQLANCCCENQRNTDALRYDMAQQFAQANAVTTNQTQKILDALAQNKIDSLQAKVNQLETQNMFCGIPRINPYGYGVYQYANNVGCGCGTIA